MQLMLVINRLPHFLKDMIRIDLLGVLGLPYIYRQIFFMLVSMCL